MTTHESVDHLLSNAVLGAQAENEAAKIAARTRRKGAKRDALGASSTPAPVSWANPDDPLEGLAQRVRDGGAAQAYEPAVLEAAASAENAPSIAAMRKDLAAALKSHGDGIARWERAVADARRERKRAERARATEEARAAREKRRARREDFEARAATIATEPPEGSEDPFYREGACFTLDSSGLVYHRIDRRNDAIIDERLTWFPLAIEAQRVWLEGDKRQCEYRVRTVDRTFIVSASEFLSGTFLPRELGVHARVATRAEVNYNAWQTAAQGLLALWGDAPVERVFRQTGWHAVDGAWLYVDAGGALGAQGRVPAVRAEIAGEMTNFECYALPDPSSGTQLATDARETLELLAGLDRPDIVSPVIALALRSLLGTSRAQVFIHGLPGLGKSELCALAMRLFGAGFRNGRPPASFTASRAVLDVTLATAGDTLVTIDDADTNTEPGTRHFRDVTQAVLAAAWNGRPAARAQIDGKVRATPRYRSTALCAAEKPPTGASLVDRILVIELFERLSTDLGPFIEKGNAGVYARAMSAYVAWLAARLETVRAELPSIEHDCGRPFASCGERVAVTAGALLAGVEMFSRFARDVGVSADDLLARAREGIAAAARGQVDVREAEQPGVVALELLRSAVQAGHAHFETPTGEPPTAPHRWGFRRDDAWALRSGTTGDSEERRENFRASATRVGLVGYEKQRPGEVALFPDVAVKVLRRAAREQGRELAIDSARQLGVMLARAGLLTRAKGTDGGRDTYRTRISVGRGEAREPMLCVRWSNDEAPAVESPPPATPAPVVRITPTVTRKAGSF